MRAVRRMDGDEAPRDAKPEQRLERLADMLVSKGLGGEVPALREIGDRLDGKPAQAITGEAENPLNIVHEIRRTIIRPNDTRP